jgi:hypothetical protein
MSTYLALYNRIFIPGESPRCQGFRPKFKSVNLPYLKSVDYDDKERQKIPKDSIVLLHQFAVEIRKNTSFWYGGWLASFFRSQWKERALDTTISALSHSMKNTIPIKGNTVRILQGIIQNAMITRGSFIKASQKGVNTALLNKTTCSGSKAVELLKMPTFEPLRNLLKMNGDLTYVQLEDKIIAANKKETSVPYQRLCYTRILR